MVWLSIEEPARKKRRIGVYLIGALAVLVGGGATVAMLVKIIDIIAEKNSPAVVLAPCSHDEVFAESYRVFSDYDGAAAPPSEEEYAAIRAVIEKIGECSANGDDASFAKLADAKRINRLIEMHGGYRGLNAVDKTMARRQAIGMSVESYWCNPTIVGVVTPADERNTRVVYLLTTYPNDVEQFESRVLLGREGNNWRLYDWQRLDLGLTHSEFIAAWLQATLVAREDRFSPWLKAVKAADAAVEKGESEEAGRHLREAEQTLPIGDLRDYCLLLTGYRWQSEGLSEDALRCFKGVQSPDRFPGAYYGIHNSVKAESPEEALNHARAYATLIGPSAGACRVQAQLLSQLKRKEDSLAMWREVLRSKPDDAAALSKMVIGWADDEKQRVLPLLLRCTDPVEAAAQTAELLVYEDYNGLRVLADFLKERAPQSAERHNAAGALQSMDGLYAAAMASYRKAIDAAEDQSAYEWSYLEAAASAGQVADAIEALPDPKAGFDAFTYAYDDGEMEITADEYSDIVARRFAATPEDHAVAARMAEALDEAGRTAEAESLIRKTLQRLDSEELDEDAQYTRDALASDLVRILYQTGRWEQAYPGADKSDNALETLVRLAAEDRREDVLKALYDRAKAANAAPASLASTAGELALLEGRPSEAARHFKAAADAVEDYRGWLYRHKQLQACLKAGEWRAFYGGAEDRGDAFDRLSHQLIEREDWAALQQLWTLHESQPKATQAVLISKSRAALARKDYKECLRVTSEVILKPSDDLASYEIRSIVDQRMIAMLRTQQYAAAKRFAEERKDEALSAVVYAATGDPLAAQQAAIKAAIRDPSLSSLYHHDLVGPQFLTQTYSPLHDEFPVSLPYDSSESIATLYASQPKAITSPDIREAIDQLADPLQGPLQRATSHVSGIDHVAVMAVGDAAVWVMIGTAGSTDDLRAKQDDPEWASTVNAPKSWASVGVSAWTSDARDQAEVVARRLAALLFSGREGAVRLKPKVGYSSSTVHPNHADLLTAWSSENDLEAFAHDAVELTYINETDITAERGFRDSLFAAFRSMNSDPEKRLLVAIETPGAEGFGANWLKVESVARSYGGLQFTGPLLADSQILPVLRAGTPVKVASYNVVAWRWADDPQAITWRQPQSAEDEPALNP